MEDLVKQDIFFFVATIVVAVVGVLMTIALVYFLKILSDIRYISKHARKEGVAFLEDVRTSLVKTATNIPKLVGMVGIATKLFGFGKEVKKRKTKSKSKK